jgi:hypothetical protein
MPLQYTYAVKVFTAALLGCGAVYLLEYPRLAGYMLMTTGCVALGITIGSSAGWIDVVGRDGRVISPAHLTRVSVR